MILHEDGSHKELTLHHILCFIYQDHWVMRAEVGGDMQINFWAHTFFHILKQSEPFGTRIPFAHLI